MRKIAVLLLTAAALAAAAQPAAADIPSYEFTSVQGTTTNHWCTTPFVYGVHGQYGAWGDFIDGCTESLSCPWSSAGGCTASEETSITTWYTRGEHVTQNARLRVYNTAGALVWYRDRSCAGLNTCTNTDAIHIWPGESASVQCNGVREHVYAGNSVRNTCTVRMNSAG